MFTTVNEKTADGRSRLTIISANGIRFIVEELPEGYLNIRKDIPNSLNIIIHRDNFELPFHTLTQVTIK